MFRRNNGVPAVPVQRAVATSPPQSDERRPREAGPDTPRPNPLQSSSSGDVYGRTIAASGKGLSQLTPRTRPRSGSSPVELDTQDMGQQASQALALSDSPRMRLGLLSRKNEANTSPRVKGETPRSTSKDCDLSSSPRP